MSVSDKGLKKGAIGFIDGLAIGLDSTAPAYSLAAVIESIVLVVGVQAPGVLLLSFVPMFFIAAAFFYMNKAVQDCGTSFAWVTRAMGPWWGWPGGRSARPESWSSARSRTSRPSTCSTSSDWTACAIRELLWSRSRPC